MSFELQQYISKLSLDLQAGLITVDRANELATKARGLADRRGNLGEKDRIALRYGVGKSGQRTPTTDTGTGDTGTGDTGTGDTGAGDTGTVDNTPVDTGPSPQTVATRTNAREYLRGLFKQFGFSDADSLSLMGQVEGWIQSGLADAGTDAVLMKFRETDTYKRRFAGMAELIGRGQAISEAEYIQLETSYRNVMSNYGLPTTYYDTPEDYARLIGAGLSAKEVEERVVAAKQAMNPLVAAELREYYGVGDGDLTAYMLGLTDEKGLQTASARNQEEIRQRGRLAQVGAAAERAGFSMDRAGAERLAGTSIGQTIDPFQMQTMSRLEGTFDQARRVADRETTLAGIDRETFNETDALDAAFGDRQKQLASERRGRRERARFAGSGGASAGSLAVERNF
jgi:hypothetical protein